MRVMDWCQGMNLQRVPKWVVFADSFFKTIDSFHIGSRIAPIMYSSLITALATPRTRRPKPTSLRRLGVFCFDGEANATVR